MRKDGLICFSVASFFLVQELMPLAVGFCSLWAVYVSCSLKKELPSFFILGCSSLLFC